MNSYVKQYAHFFESLTKESPLESYELFFNEKSTFEDPFQKVQGLDSIYRVFQHMYDTLYEPMFRVTEVVENNAVAYIKWDFNFKLSQNDEIQSFEGLSRAEFSEDGKIISHTDYWDAAYNVYEKIPLLGSVLRLIKRKIRA